MFSEQKSPAKENKSTTVEFIVMNESKVSESDCSEEINLIRTQHIPKKCIINGNSSMTSNMRQLKQEYSVMQNESTCANIPRRNYPDNKNISKISGLDCSTGISMIESLPQTNSQFSIMENESNISELPRRNFLDYTNLPDVSGTSMITSFHQISTQQVSHISMFAEREPSVDLPSFDFTDTSIPIISTKNSLTQLRSNLSRKKPSGEVSVQMDCSGPEPYSLVSSFCNVDDTQQLLRDASRLNSTKNISFLDSSNGTSTNGANKTYCTENKIECVEENSGLGYHGSEVASNSIKEIKETSGKELNLYKEKSDMDENMENEPIPDLFIVSCNFWESYKYAIIITKYFSDSQKNTFYLKVSNNLAQNFVNNYVNYIML